VPPIKAQTSFRPPVCRAPTLGARTGVSARTQPRTTAPQSPVGPRSLPPDATPKRLPAIAESGKRYRSPSSVLNVTVSVRSTDTASASHITAPMQATASGSFATAIQLSSTRCHRFHMMYRYNSGYRLAEVREAHRKSSCRTQTNRSESTWVAQDNSLDAHRPRLSMPHIHLIEAKKPSLLVRRYE